MKFWLAFSLVLTPYFAQAADSTQFDALVQSCLVNPSGYPLCETVLTIKALGDDSIEAIKEYMDLKPYQYTALTALNFVLTGRLRIKTHSRYLLGAEEVYDFQPGQFTFLIQTEF